MRPSGPAEPRRPALLVAQTSFLGDVVLTTPLVAALRRRLAPRSLTVLVRPDCVPLVEGHAAVDQVLVDDKRGRDSGLRGLVRTARRLRAGGFDLAVAPHRSLRTAIVLSLAGIPRRIGFSDSRGAFLFHQCVARDRAQHDILRNLSLLAPFGGGRDEQVTLSVPVAAAARNAAARLVPAGDGPLVGVAPGSVWATKRWSVHGFSAVVSALCDDGCRCVILGMPADADAAVEIARASRGRARVLAGHTDLATLIAVIERLALLVGNDSAPMHIACALGVPVVAVFCATTPGLGYGPWGQQVRVVEAALECRPCGPPGGRTCPRGTSDCIHLVSAGRVLAAARELLASRRVA